MMLSAGRARRKAGTTRIAAASPMLIRWREANRIGAPDMRPSSLANAITDPVKVMAPMATPTPISTIEPPAMSPGVPMPKASGE